MTIDILFICRRNAVRSAMAEGLLRAKSQEKLNVASVGLSPEEMVYPNAVKIMQDHDIDISAHIPRGLEAVEGEDIKQIIFVSSSDVPDEITQLVADKNAVFAVWSIEEPGILQGSQQMVLMQYRTIYDKLLTHINDFFTNS